MSDLLNTILTWCTSTGIKIVIAIVILIIAFAIINKVTKKLTNYLLQKKGLDETLTKTLSAAARIVLKVIVVVSLIGYLGIDTSGIAALIASLGVAAGLALNGALGNLAGGILILLTRPFKIGDFITAQGYSGTVESISIVSTKILTVDNRVVYLPNGALSSGNIENLSEEDLRRVDQDFSVGGNDPRKVEAVLLDVCEKYDKVLKDPAPFARVTDYGAGNGVKVTLRAWVKSTDYWDCYFDLLQRINEAFDANGIVIPFNRMDVHNV